MEIQRQTRLLTPRRLQHGERLAQTAREMQLPYMTVHSVWQHYHQTGQIKPNDQGSGDLCTGGGAEGGASDLGSRFCLGGVGGAAAAGKEESQGAEKSLYEGLFGFTGMGDPGDKLT